MFVKNEALFYNLNLKGTPGEINNVKINVFVISISLVRHTCRYVDSAFSK